MCSFNKAYTGMILTAGITEKVLCTSQNLDLLKRLCQKYVRSGIVQKTTFEISLKCSHSLEGKLSLLNDATA